MRGDRAFADNRVVGRSVAIRLLVVHDVVLDHLALDAPDSCRPGTGPRRTSQMPGPHGPVRCRIVGPSTTFAPLPHSSAPRVCPYRAVARSSGGTSHRCGSWRDTGSVLAERTGPVASDAGPGYRAGCWPGQTGIAAPSDAVRVASFSAPVIAASISSARCSGLSAVSIQARSLWTAVRRRLAPTVAEAGPGARPGRRRRRGDRRRSAVSRGRGSAHSIPWPIGWGKEKMRLASRYGHGAGCRAAQRRVWMRAVAE